MKKDLYDLDPERLWGDGGPYSQVHVGREIRILDDSVSREFYTVYACINPASYEILSRDKDLIRDERIVKILNNSKYKNKNYGYIWDIGHGMEFDPGKVTNLINYGVESVIAMHKLVINILKTTVGFSRRDKG